jgi:hypothetical protein
VGSRPSWAECMKVQKIGRPGIYADGNGLYRVLAPQQPVHRRIQIVLARLGTPKSSASVVVCHQRVVASLVCGAVMRAATIANTRSRSGHGLEASNDSKPKRCMATPC